MTPPPRDEAVPLWIFRYCPGLYCDKEIHGDAASHVALPAAAYAALVAENEAMRAERDAGGGWQVSARMDKPEYIKCVVGWILDDTRHAPILREKAWHGRCLSGVYDGKSEKIRDLVTLAYLRGVHRGASCAWEARQPVALRDIAT